MIYILNIEIAIKNIIKIIYFIIFLVELMSHEFFIIVMNEFFFEHMSSKNENNKGLEGKRRVHLENGKPRWKGRHPTLISTFEN